MIASASDWRMAARVRAVEHFRLAWERSPALGREALVRAAERGSVGHRWEGATRACVLSLLVSPALRAGESPKAGANRLFGCEVTDDFPVTWDAGGVTLTDLLGAVGIHPRPARGAFRLIPRPNTGGSPD